MINTRTTRTIQQWLGCWLMLLLVACGSTEPDPTVDTGQLVATQVALALAETEAFEQAVSAEMTRLAPTDLPTAPATPTAAAQLATDTPKPPATPTTPATLAIDSEATATTVQQIAAAETNNRHATATADTANRSATATANVVPTATPTLIPIVKQGAPGDRQGIGGNVFSYAGIPIQNDPSVFGDQIIYMVRDVFDTAVGQNEGDGVEEVRFTIIDENGVTVHERVEKIPTYCAFGGDSQCIVWSFSANGNTWPNGTPAKSGFYDAGVSAVGTNRSRTAFWSYSFELRLPNDPQTVQPRVQITHISLQGDQYQVHFETVGYTPLLTGNDKHIHFYFNTVSPADAGVPGFGPWTLYPNAPGSPNTSPFTLLTVADRPPNATALCALVANPDHTVIEGSGNCVNLP